MSDETQTDGGDETEIETRTDAEAGAGVNATLPRGSRIGRYLVQGELGRGGMGVVYRARDEELGRDVALKLLTVGDPRRWQRFAREMRSLARLDHPHVVPVWDNGVEGERPYLVMPLLAGTALSERLEQAGPLAPRAAAELTHDLARAVAHAHERGVLHRDIKPANVLLTDDGERAVLTDFGLAKDLQGLDESRVSFDGQSLGTPGYWAPEQACGALDRVGPATDVYGLGATLYACLTGQAPIRREGGFLEQLRAVAATPPQPPSRLADVDPALDAICLRCLAKEPAERPPGAAALADELEAYLATSPTARSRAPLALALVAAAIGVAAFAVAVRAPVPTDPEPPRPTRAARSAPPAPTRTDSERRKAQAEHERKLALSGRINQVIALSQRQRYAEALAIAERLVAEHPQNHLAWAARGRAHYYAKNFDQAQPDLERALSLNASSPLALETRGQLREATGDLVGARTDLEAAVALKPGWPDAWVNLGIVRIGCRDYPGAFAAFDQALGLDPRHKNALANRALLQMRLDDLRAIATFERALLDYTPGNRFGDKLAAQLKGFLEQVKLARDAQPTGNKPWRRYDRFLRRGQAALRSYEARRPR